MSNNATPAQGRSGGIDWKQLLSWAPVAVMAGVVFYAYVWIPTPVALRWWAPGRTAVMQQRVSEARATDRDFELRHTWVGLDAISRNLQRAVVAAEDGHFWEHDGVDWAAIGEELRYRGDDDFSWRDPADREALADALRYLRANSSEVKGRSTITQQLAKNLYFSTDRSLIRKVEELLVTRRIERFVPKDRILELYLNLAEFGPGLFGAEAAAREYFGVAAADLDPFQAASLAATLPHPRTSNPASNPGRMAWRRDRILGMLRGGAGEPGAPVPPPIPVIADPDPELVDEAVENLAGEAVDSAVSDSVGEPVLEDDPPTDPAPVDPEPEGGASPPPG